MGDSSGGYQFGGWLVEPHLNRVSRDDEVHQIEPRTMDVLAHLKKTLIFWFKTSVAVVCI